MFPDIIHIPAGSGIFKLLGLFAKLSGTYDSCGAFQGVYPDNVVPDVVALVIILYLYLISSLILSRYCLSYMSAIPRSKACSCSNIGVVKA